MLTRNLSHYVDTASTAWRDSKIPGVQFLPLNADGDDKQGTILLRMNPGATYPRHRHPAGEEILMLKGEMTAGERKLKSGDYLYSPPGSIHEMKSEGGAVFLSILPKPTTFISLGHTEDIEAPADVPPESTPAT